MCDEKTMDDMDEYLRRSGNLSRRQFAAVSVATGLAALLPRAAAGPRRDRSGHPKSKRLMAWRIAILCTLRAASIRAF